MGGRYNWRLNQIIESNQTSCILIGCNKSVRSTNTNTFKFDRNSNSLQSIFCRRCKFDLIVANFNYKYIFSSWEIFSVTNSSKTGSCNTDCRCNAAISIITNCFTCNIEMVWNSNSVCIDTNNVRIITNEIFLKYWSLDFTMYVYDFKSFVFIILSKKYFYQI